MAKPKTVLILCNLGAPATDSKAAISSYLNRLLSDRQLAPHRSPIWRLVFKLFILPSLRKKNLLALKSLMPGPDSNYQSISQHQQQALQQKLGEEIKVELIMRYRDPDVHRNIDRLLSDGYEQMIILPLLPQQSVVRSSCTNNLTKSISKTAGSASVSVIGDYHGDPDYIHALASSVQEHWRQQQRQRFLLISFAGLPQATDDADESYYDQCLGTANLLATILGLSYSQWALGFFSFNGRPTRLEPNSAHTLAAMAAQGLKEVDVISPGFASDCLETRVHVQVEDRASFLAHGGEQYHYIPCLNDRDDHIDMMAQLVRPYLDDAGPDESAPDT